VRGCASRSLMAQRAQPAQTRRERDRTATLVEEICARRAVLFVGAGVSACLGLPSWQELIERLGEDLGYDADEFLDLSADFRSLTEFYRLEKGSLDAPRTWMKREWAVDDATLHASVAHALIVRLGFPLIYTTNYDHLLERAFALHGERCNKMITAKDIAQADPALTTIVKFHGDVDDERSLVVTESDYFRRAAFQDPLDIKLSADALGRTLLFIGYSLSDINMRLLLYRLRGVWLDSGHESSQPPSYIFLPKPNPVQERILDSWGITPLVGANGADESAALVAFLERLYAAVERKRRR